MPLARQVSVGYVRRADYNSKLIGHTLTELVDLQASHHTRSQPHLAHPRSHRRTTR